VATQDPYLWVNFSFYPCPVGADTPAGCTANPGPFPGVNADCCTNDKFEACMVAQLQCFPGSAVCDNALRTKMAAFLKCLEGSFISEGQCPGDPKTCMGVANLTAYYPAIATCYNTPAAAQKASQAMNATCTAENPKSWPHVRINNKLMCEDDSCFMPLLPFLCDGTLVRSRCGCVLIVFVFVF
jgi:hypothetical protein